MVQKVIIDCDPGIGDAVAIAMAILDPDIDLVGITATAGCVPGKQATHNVQAIVESLDPRKWPRLGRCDALAPVLADSDRVAVNHPRRLNGPSGLGDFDFQAADLHRPHESAKLLVELVRNQPDEIVLLTLGPLTNVEVASELNPEFLEMLGGLYCLGGSMAAGGDVTAAAEFNIYADAQAAQSVLRSPATKTLIPLDVSCEVVLTFEQFNRIKQSGLNELAWLWEQLLACAFRAHHEHLGLEGVRLNEVVALAAITQSRLFERQAMAIDVETHGELTRGMTVFDRRRGIRHWQTNIDVLCQVDAQGVLDYFTRVTQAAVR